MSFNSAQDVKSIFRKFDKNGDGHLDKSEIKQMLQSSGKNASDQEVEQMFRQGDADGDGLIDIQEFTMLMFPAAAQP
jgi:Ca2+-binding EF-hand superfamily protein